MKKTILTVIITAVICISGTAFAVTQMNASEIEYDSTHSVKDKIDDLYTTATTFKNLTTTTTATSNDLLSGKTAYDNLGNLITGNISTDCVSGSFVVNNDAYSAGQLISSNITPNMFMIYWSNKRISYYDKNVSESKVIFYDVTPDYQERDLSQNFTINDTNLYLKLGNTSFLGKTFKYMICR